MRMISKQLRNAVKLSDKKGYQIAHLANLHPSVLSRIICGIDKVKPGDARVLAIGKVVGVSEAECFDGNSTELEFDEN